MAGGKERWKWGGLPGHMGGKGLKETCGWGQDTCM